VLTGHLPAQAESILGGFVFSQTGNESKQIDIIIAHSLTPRFLRNISDKNSKSIVCVDGCLGVAECKSDLNGKTIEESLHNLASIPAGLDRSKRNLSPMIQVRDELLRPYKMIFARNSISLDALRNHLARIISQYPQILPDLIYVPQEYCGIYVGVEGGTLNDGTKIEPDSMFFQTHEPDLAAITHIVENVHKRLMIVAHSLTSYTALFESLRS